MDKVQRLEMEIEGHKKAFDLMLKGMESIVGLLDYLKHENRRLVKENESLKEQAEAK